MPLGKLYHNLSVGCELFCFPVIYRDCQEGQKVKAQVKGSSSSLSLDPAFEPVSVICLVKAGNISLRSTNKPARTLSITLPGIGGSDGDTITPGDSSAGEEGIVAVAVVVADSSLTGPHKHFVSGMDY